MNKKLLIGLSILILVVAISGCTNNSSNTKEELKVSDVYIYTPAPSTGTYVGGTLRNNGNHDYKNIVLMVSALDSSFNVVAQKKSYVTYLKAGDSAVPDALFPYDSKIVAGDMKVLNATPV